MHLLQKNVNFNLSGLLAAKNRKYRRNNFENEMMKDWRVPSMKARRDQPPCHWNPGKKRLNSVRLEKLYLRQASRLAHNFFLRYAVHFNSGRQ